MSYTSEVQAMIPKFLSQWDAGNAEGIASFHTEDCSIVSRLAPSPETVTGRKEQVSFLSKMLPELAGKHSFENLRLRPLAPDLVFFDHTHVIEKDSAPVRSHGFQASRLNVCGVLRKEGGEWRYDTVRVTPAT